MRPVNFFSGENRLAYWNFRDVGVIEYEKSKLDVTQAKHFHSVPISCIEISIDGITAVTGKLFCLKSILTYGFI